MRILLTYILILFFLATKSQETIMHYLSGTDAANTKQWQFFCTDGANSNKWTTIQVPSCWEQQGFGKYNYGFAKDSVRGKEKGLYKLEFDVPNAWKNKNINIVFEGVMTDAEVKINGIVAGPIHQGAYYAFKYDITKLLKYGAKNLLEVTVAKHSANESVNNAERKADYWIFGGIFRPVYLEVNQGYLFRNINIDAKANGDFFAEVTDMPWSWKDCRDDVMYNVEIFNSKGKKVAIAYGGNCDHMTCESRVKCKISDKDLWSSENPILFTAVFTFKTLKKKEIIHVVKKKFGFRTIEVKKRDGIYINGVKVKLKGVNRSPFRPETGRAVSKQNSIEDVLLMKDMNMNAVRCSHYPPDQHFLDACDSLGLYVIDELAGWHGNYDDTTGGKLVGEMIKSDANHPCIILWANGNEGGHNFNLDALFTLYDYQQRTVIHPWQLHNGIETQHYREYNYGVGNYEYGKEIVMPTEFLHGQFDGGHGAGLADYWEKMWHTPNSAGGFLWDFMDQAIMRKDLNDSLDTDKYRAADGIVGPHLEKEGSYYAIKEIWSPVKILTKNITKEWDGILEVENRFHFTNLKDCKFTCKVVQVINEEFIKCEVISPSIRPNEKGALKIQLPSKWKDYDVIAIEAFNPNGKQIYKWTFPIKIPKDYVKVLQFAEVKQNFKVDVTKIEDSITLVKVSDISYFFNNKNGSINRIKWKDNLLPISNGPVLCEGDAIADSMAIKKDSILNVSNIIFYFPKKSLIQKLVYSIDYWATLKMEIHYFPAAYFTNTVGVSFNYSENDILSVDYLGNGPYRVWKNRMAGTSFGAWSKKYNTTETGEQWNYPEFKGYYSNFYGASFRFKNEKGFSVFTETEDLFLRLFTPKWKTDQWHNYETIFPKGDISFMQGISSIGSKTQRNETTGPMGLKNIFYDYEKDASRALKMILYFSFENK